MFVLTFQDTDGSSVWVIAASTSRATLEEKATDTENNLNHVEPPDPEAVLSSFEELRTGTWGWTVDLAEYLITAVPVL